MRRDIQELSKGVHIVVGTSGRVHDMIKHGALKREKIKIVCIDEADEMLSQRGKLEITKGESFPSSPSGSIETENITLPKSISFGPDPSEGETGYLSIRHNPWECVAGHDQGHHERPCQDSRQKGATHPRRHPTILHSHGKGGMEARDTV